MQIQVSFFGFGEHTRMKESCRDLIASTSVFGAFSEKGFVVEGEIMLVEGFGFSGSSKFERAEASMMLESEHRADGASDSFRMAVATLH